MPFGRRFSPNSTLMVPTSPLPSATSAWGFPSLATSNSRDRNRPRPALGDGRTLTCSFQAAERLRQACAVSVTSKRRRTINLNDVTVYAVHEPGGTFIGYTFDARWLR